MSEKKSVVRVSIVGEEYTIRTAASLEHTRAVAQYVDQAIRAVLNAGTVVESHKAAILAALQITDQLFQAREEQGELTQAMRGLARDVDAWMPAHKSAGD
ncbi:MAG: cell division protein ZapA [Gemmatimonadota bacterium]|nr:cell division protein ZapA [Gemmatimonadota bacterium]